MVAVGDVKNPGAIKELRVEPLTVKPMVVVEDVSIWVAPRAQKVEPITV